MRTFFMMHLKMQKLLLVIKVYFWIIFTAHLNKWQKMTFGGAAAFNEFVKKTWICIIYLTTLSSRTAIQATCLKIHFWLFIGTEGVYTSITLEIGFTVLWSSLWILLMALVHIYLRVFLCCSTNMLTFSLSMLLLSFLTFMFNVSIINVFKHIFVSEVILKTRLIKTKHTRATYLNLTLLSSWSYLRGFILFDYNASWHWKMLCRNWEFQ